MLRTITTAGIALVFIALAGCGIRSPQPWDGAADAPQLSAAGLGYYWQHEVQLRSGERVRTLWPRGEYLYVLTTANRVLAYDAATGVYRWTFAFRPDDAQIYAPCQADNVQLPPLPGPNIAVNPPAPESYRGYDVVVFNSSTTAWVLHRGSGELLHEINLSRLDVLASTGGTCDQSRLFVASIRGRFYAINLASGMTDWQLTSDGRISASLRLIDDELLAASDGGTIYRVVPDTDSARIRWQRSLPDGILADLAIADQTLYAGSLDYSVYAIAADDGSILWQARTGSPIRQSVQLGQRNVYARSEGGTLFAIDPASGETRWTLPGGLSVLAESGQQVYVRVDGELAVLDTVTGQRGSGIDLGSLTIFAPTPAEAMFFAASPRGLLAMIRPAGAGYVRPEQLRLEPPGAGTAEPPAAPQP